MLLQKLSPEQKQKIIENPPLHKIYLCAQLRHYLMSNVGCHKQGTEEWKKAKEVTIGGSEIATVLGLNRFSTITELLYGKLGLIPRKRDIKMQWGKVFEPLICEYVERDKDVEILGQDLFVLGKKSNQSYSPDGLGVMLVDINNNGTTNLPKLEVLSEESNSSPKKEYRTILFEFKCPYNRLLKGGVPEYYLPQVLTGLDTIPIVDQGIFIEAMFRRCLWQDCDDTPTYDHELTPRDLVRTAYKPLARGFVLFALDESALTNNAHIIKLSRLHNLMKNATYSVQKTEITSDELNVGATDSSEIVSPPVTPITPTTNHAIIYNKPTSYSAQQRPQAHHLPVFGKCLRCEDRYILEPKITNEPKKCKCGAVFFDELADLGDCPYDIFEFMLDLYEDKILRPIYSKMFLIGNCQQNHRNNEELQPQLEKMLNEAKQQNLLIYGILPYKLLRIEYNFVDKIPGYVENLCQSKIDELINIVKKCKENPAESKSVISRYVTAKYNESN